MLRLLDRQLFSVNEKFKSVQRVRFEGPVIMASVDPPEETDEELLRRLDALIYLSHDVWTCEGCDLEASMLGQSQFFANVENDEEFV